MFVFLIACAESFPSAQSLASRLAAAGREAGRKLAFMETAEGALPGAIAEHERAGLEAALLLTGPAALPEALERADLLVILVAAKRGTVQAALRLAERAEALRLPYYFLLAQESGEDASVAAAALSLAQQGPVFTILDQGTSLPADLWKELWRRAGQIPRLGVRLSGTRAAEDERRRFDRWLYRQTATLWRGGLPITCEMHDISPGGVALEVPDNFEPADELELHLPLLGRFEVEVAYFNDPILGLRFPLRSAAQTALVSELSRLLEASSPSEAPPAAMATGERPAWTQRHDVRLRLVRGLEELLLLAERRAQLIGRLASIHRQARERRPAA